MVIAFALAALAGAASWSSAEDAGPIYQKYCASCHGEDGSGNGPAAGMLAKPPADFRDCAAIGSRPREEQVKIVTQGGGSVGRSPQMPSFGTSLSAQQIAALVDYIRTAFCEED